MNVLETALRMLEKYPLCDHCLGRQFALLGHGLENDERGKAIKTTLTLEAHTLVHSKHDEGLGILQILATNGFSEPAKQVLNKLKESIPKNLLAESCFLCENKFDIVGELAEKALKRLEGYEYHNFLVGVHLPGSFEEREDEFKAEFEVCYGENMRNEFGRTIGKKIGERTGKNVEYQKPEMVVLVNPVKEEIRLQVNPLYVAGRYRKLVRGIPQSKWLCSSCQGKGCKECNWTGKMYPESVAEIIEKPFLDATEGVDSSFHASGREDIDARMLGKGRPFVIEIKQPRKRFLNLEKLEETVNAYADGKVEVSNLLFADKGTVRNLKKSESAQKEYLVVIEFADNITPEDLRLVREKLTDTLVKQRTPKRVSHRRADLTREKYIYDVKLKKLSTKKAEMRLRCQGGLYIKELVTGDGGRTNPNVSQIIENEAEPVKLDVLNIIRKEQEVERK